MADQSTRTHTHTNRRVLSLPLQQMHCGKIRTRYFRVAHCYISNNVISNSSCLPELFGPATLINISQKVIFSSVRDTEEGGEATAAQRLTGSWETSRVGVSTGTATAVRVQLEKEWRSQRAVKRHRETNQAGANTNLNTWAMQQCRTRITIW